MILREDRKIMLSEKAKSRAQQRFFGMVRSAQKGEMKNPSSEVSQTASSMSKSDVKKMASTKHKGLPEKKDIQERLGGKGYKSYTSLTGKKVSGDWEDSDRGAGNKATRRAGGTVKAKSPTYIAHVVNKGKKKVDPKKNPVVNEAKKVEEKSKGRHPRDQKELDRAVAYIKKNPNFGKVSEAKEEQGRSDYGKASVRNKRKFGKEGEPAVFDASGERGKMIDQRRAEHKAKRGVKEEVVTERLGGKGYKPYTSLTGKKVSGDWEDSDRGAGNKAKKRAGGKVEKKSPTYLAHVHNKEEVEPVNEGEYSAKAAMYQSGMTDASRVKGPVGKAVDKVKNVFKKKEKGGEYRAKAAMYMSGYVPEGEMIEGIMQMIKRVGKKPEPKKHDYGRDAGNIARKKLEKKERETYVNDMSNSFGEESKYYKGNPKGTPKKPKAGDRRPGVKEEKNYVEFMKRVEKLPEVTRDSIKALGDDPLVAKAALEISGLPK